MLLAFSERDTKHQVHKTDLVPQHIKVFKRLVAVHLLMSDRQVFLRPIAHLTSSAKILYTYLPYSDIKKTRFTWENAW